jgi:3-dehydroquinate dehydratase
MPLYPQEQCYAQLKVITIIVSFHQNFSTAHEVNDTAYLLFLTDGRFIKTKVQKRVSFKLLYLLSFSSHHTKYTMDIITIYIGSLFHPSAHLKETISFDLYYSCKK